MPAYRRGGHSNEPAPADDADDDALLEMPIEEVVAIEVPELSPVEPRQRRRRRQRCPSRYRSFAPHRSVLFPEETSKNRRRGRVPTAALNPRAIDRWRRSGITRQ